MKGDFSSDRFNPRKHYNRVLRQQGRVEIDSDANEQAAITHYLIRTLIADFLGHAGGPAHACGFGLGDPKGGLKPVATDFVIGPGRYYVDGLLVENEHPILFSEQPELPAPPRLDAGKTYLAYLDVWQRHITYLEDDSIREVALGGPDTSTRVKTTWQVRLLESGAPVAPPSPDKGKLEQQIREAHLKLEKAKKAFAVENDRVKRGALKKTIDRLEREIAALEARLREGELGAPPPAAPADECGDLLKPLVEWASGTLAARVTPSGSADSPCVLSPESRYRGLENQLYRIEIHTSGDTADESQVPTFKWSRENGSVVTRWLGTSGNDVRVGSTRNFSPGQWVEFTTEDDDLTGAKGPLSRITRVEGDVLTVEGAPAWPQGKRNPKVRRWDQTANDEITLDGGAIPVAADADQSDWIPIEDGIEVQFSAGQYRTGDYWLVPARVATGAIEWPMTDSDGDGVPETPVSRSPRGIKHHYAPLFTVEALGKEPYFNLVKDCRCRFLPLPCLDDK